MNREDQLIHTGKQVCTQSKCPSRLWNLRTPEMEHQRPNKFKHTCMEIVPDCKTLTWLELFKSFKINSWQLDKSEDIKHLMFHWHPCVEGWNVTSIKDGRSPHRAEKVLIHWCKFRERQVAFCFETFRLKSTDLNNDSIRNQKYEWAAIGRFFLTPKSLMSCFGCVCL